MADSNDKVHAPGPEAPTALRPFVVAARVLLLILAGGAVAAALVIARPGGDTGARYACPMHPEVRAAAPGECPICRMALEPLGRGLAPASRRQMAAMADVNAVENVRKHNVVDFVRKRSLLFGGRDLRGPAWVDSDGTVAALFYRDQIDALGPDELGTFYPTESPKRSFAVRRSAGAAVPWDASTAQLRFQIVVAGGGAKKNIASPPPPPASPSASAPVGQVGWLELAPRSREVLAVPATAVVQSPEGPYVLAWVKDFTFEKRPIEIGETFAKQGYAVVLSGLRVNERVVSRATFFVDADRRIGSNPGSVNQ